MGMPLTPLQKLGIWPKSQAAQIAAERTAFALMRAQRVKTNRDVGRAAAHILRTMKVPNADPDGHIEVVIGSRTVRELHKAIKLRVNELKPTSGGDPTRLIHFVCALPNRPWAETAARERPEELEALKRRMESYVKRQFGSEQVMLLVWHYDEETPHLHALVLPLEERLETRGRKPKDGAKRTRRSRWFYNASAWFGTRASAITEMSRRQDDYAEWVAGFGLVRGERGSKAKHLNGAARMALLCAAAEQNEADAAKNAADAEANQAERARLDARKAAWARDSAAAQQAIVEEAEQNAAAIVKAAEADAAKRLAELDAHIAEETGRRVNAELDRLLALAEKARETTEAERAARDADVQTALKVVVAETERVVAAAAPEGHRYAPYAQAALAKLKAAAGIVATPAPKTYYERLVRLRAEGLIPAFAPARPPAMEKSPQPRHAERAQAAKQRQDEEWSRGRTIGPTNS